MVTVYQDDRGRTKGGRGSFASTARRSTPSMRAPHGYTFGVYTRRMTNTGEGMSRRRLIGSALALGATLPLGLQGRASAAPARLRLPAPTGPFPIGTATLHLVDRDRPDPLAGPGHYRELMAAVWYPARDVEG